MILTCQRSLYFLLFFFLGRRFYYPHAVDNFPKKLWITWITFKKLWITFQINLKRAPGRYLFRSSNSNETSKQKPLACGLGADDQSGWLVDGLVCLGFPPASDDDSVATGVDFGGAKEPSHCLGDA